MPGEGTADDPRSTPGERHTGRSYPKEKMPRHFELLYSTLVADGALPDGYLTDFLKLEDHARRSAQRTRAQYGSMSVDSAARELQDLQKQQSSKEEVDRQLADQLVMLAELKPRKVPDQDAVSCLRGTDGAS